MANDELVELRGNTPRQIIDVIDAVSSARRISRIELVNRILSKWARDQLHEANVVARVIRGNPPLVEGEWS
jgi:hypothetical protein